MVRFRPLVLLYSNFEQVSNIYNIPRPNHISFLFEITVLLNLWSSQLISHRLLRIAYCISLVKTKIYCCKYLWRTCLVHSVPLVAYFYIYGSFNFCCVLSLITFLVFGLVLFGCFLLLRCDWDKRLIFVALSVETERMEAQREKILVPYLIMKLKKYQQKLGKG